MGKGDSELKIALIDDNFDVRTIIKQLLETEGYTVGVYDSPENLKYSSERYEMYVFDWNYSDKTLIDFNLSIPKNKIILISGSSPDPSKGEYRYINKMRAEELLEALGEIKQFRSSLFEVLTVLICVVPSLLYRVQHTALETHLY